MSNTFHFKTSLLLFINRIFWLGCWVTASGCINMENASQQFGNLQKQNTEGCFFKEEKNEEENGLHFSMKLANAECNCVAAVRYSLTSKARRFSSIQRAQIYQWCVMSVLLYVKELVFASWQKKIFRVASVVGPCDQLLAEDICFT